MDVKNTSSELSYKELLNKAYDLGKKYEKNNTGCAQCTLAAVMDTLEIKNDDLFRSASGFADGIGLTGDGSCGTLVGGVMAISLIFGRERKNFSNMLKPMKSYKLAKELHAYFIERFGSCRCNDIQEKTMGRSFNLWKNRDRLAAVKHGMGDNCSSVAGDVARKTVEIIIMNMRGRAKNELRQGFQGT